tara:strand:- start:431 stop:1069 length:639 start_codon:yes stop_codon:yes gene_type:complete
MKICQKSEYKWNIKENTIVKLNNNPIYIKNNWPSAIQTTSHKKLFSCGICNRAIQSKLWFSDTLLDFDLACNHIKSILIAIEYSQQQNPKRLWPKNWPFPCCELEIEKCNLIIDEINNPNKLQTYFADSFENLNTLMPYPIYYDTINYCDFITSNYQITKYRGHYQCNCNDYTNNFLCKHINKLIKMENKKDKIINLALLITWKYFDSLNSY